ncbi:uncharacterized protein LOC119662603 [Teleopsis dalmanni]|uniref:uncharacterized protein LOC119662603 n=1 Tax=Teleopsis dalmanni TaxID=139649 RepID=UPI0018CF771A|nr:uncharacterized protein LOC119662603 [Teleopsis dalmanni]
MEDEYTSPIKKISPSKAEENYNDEMLEKTAVKHAGTLFLLKDEIARGISGTSSDTIILVNTMQSALDKHDYIKGMPCDELVKQIFTIKQTDAKYGNYRPFGVHVSYMGSDMRFYYELFEFDSKGNSYIWMYTAIGQNSETAKFIMRENVIKSGYQIDLKQAKLLALKAFIRAFNLIIITEEYIDLMTLKSVEGEIIVTQTLKEEMRELVDYLENDVISLTKSQRRVNDKLAAMRDGEFFFFEKRRPICFQLFSEDPLFMDVEPEDEEEFCEALRRIKISDFSEYFQKAAKFDPDASDLSEYQIFFKNQNILCSTPHGSISGSSWQSEDEWTLPIKKISPSKAEENYNDEMLEKTAVKHAGTLFLLKDEIARGISGTRYDSIILANAMQSALDKHVYIEGMPCDELVKQIFTIKQTDAKYGNYRPFGVHVSYMGFDMRFNYQLFQFDSKGNSFVWMYTAIGQNSEIAKFIMQENVIKSGYQIDLKQAKLLALKAFIRAFNLIIITEEYIGLMTLKSVEGKIVITQTLKKEMRELVDYLENDVISLTKSQRRVNDKLAAMTDGEFFFFEKRRPIHFQLFSEDPLFMDVEPEDEEEFCEALRRIKISDFSEYFQKAAKFDPDASDLSEYQIFFKNQNILCSTPHGSISGSSWQSEKGFDESGETSSSF